jgi:rubrerythrin
MPFPNEHSLRYRVPSKTRYVRFRRVNDAFGRGISAIYGVLRKKIGNAKTELQAIRVSSKFSSAQLEMVVRHFQKQFGMPIKVELATRKNPHEGMTEKDVIAYLIFLSNDEEDAIKEYGKFIKMIEGLPGTEDLVKTLTHIRNEERIHYNALNTFLPPLLRHGKS